jgi:Rv0078B-related antitoxin
MRPIDTTSEAYAIQTEALRRLSGEQRFMIALEMSEFARELERAGIRTQHPGWSEAEVTEEIIRRQLPPGAWPPRRA